MDLAQLRVKLARMWHRSSATDIDDAIGQAFDRIASGLDLHEVRFPFVGVTDALGGFALPLGFKRLATVYRPDGRGKMDPAPDTMDVSRLQGPTRYWRRVAAQLVLYPLPVLGTSVTLSYFGAPALVEPMATPLLSGWPRLVELCCMSELYRLTRNDAQLLATEQLLVGPDGTTGEWKKAQKAQFEL